MATMKSESWWTVPHAPATPFWKKNVPNPPVKTCEEPAELDEDPELGTFLAGDVVAGFASCVLVGTTF